MQFPTVPFAIFFLLVVSVHWLLSRWRKAQKLFLLAASLFFYGWWDWRYLGLLLASMAVNYLCGERLALSPSPERKKTWLLVAIVANLVLLGFFKYCNFFLGSLSRLASFFGLEAHLPLLSLLLPIGISFYTFQGLAYVIDLHRGVGVRARSPLDFALFISFFPQLLSGPISRSRDLLPQLDSEGPRQVPDLHRAVTLIISGLLKKTFLATFLQTHLVTDAFAVPEHYSSLELLIATYAYAALVYCDFSGYTDVARGTALLLGFHLPENFNAPYAAKSIREFWRRWHMSFSQWLRDYLYLPLGGSRGGRARTTFNLFVTFLLGGLWHGPAWKFVIWGAIHGAGLAVQRAFQDTRRAMGSARERPGARWKALLAWLLTFHLVVFAWVFFCAPDLECVSTYFSRLFQFSARGHGVELGVILFTLIGIGLNFLGRPLQDVFERAHRRIPEGLRPLAWLAIALVVLTLRPSGVAPYIYSQF